MQTESVSSTSRRRLLAAGALAVPAVSWLAGASASAVDPHVAWAAEVARLRALVEIRDAPDPDSLADLVLDIEDRLLTTPAVTLAGAREQVAAAVRFFDDYHSGIPETEGLRLAVATMDALLARGAGHA